MKYINNSHLKSHGLTPTQFKEMYPEVDAIPQEIRDANKRNSLMKKKGVKRTSSNNKQIFDYGQRVKQYEENPKYCLNCSCAISYKKRKNKFCSSSCSASLTNTIRKVVYTEEGKKSLTKVGLKNKNNLIHRRVTIHSMNVCKNCGKNFAVTGKTKYKKTCSSKCYHKNRSLNSARVGNTKTKFGYYQGIYCASSWELAFLIYNKDLGKDIQRCDLTFEYQMNEENKIYFPDFLMDATIYEVKGRDLDDVALKTQAVIDAGYKIELIRKKQINPIIKAVKEKYGVKDVTELYDEKT